jgi:hypothetical protein
VAISDGRLPSPICVPAGQIPPGYVDASGGNAFGGVGTRGWKTDPTDPTYGHGTPCDARLTKVTRVDFKPATPSRSTAHLAATRACR